MLDGGLAGRQAGVAETAMTDDYARLLAYSAVVNEILVQVIKAQPVSVQSAIKVRLAEIAQCHKLATSICGDSFLETAEVFLNDLD